MPQHYRMPDGRPLKAHVRSVAAALFAAEGRVCLSELARRLGVNHWTVRDHVARFRRAGCWHYALDQGRSARPCPEDRALVREIAAAFGPRQGRIVFACREFRRRTGRAIGVRAVRSILRSPS